MEIGVPKEIKAQEFRVGLTPSSVQALTARGHRVWVETGAGLGAGFADADYQRVGAQVGERDRVWQAELVVKVKEPLPAEYPYLQPDQILFTYLHLAASRELTMALLARGITAIAYETVALPDGRLPLLAPMSLIAGRLAVQIGAHHLEKNQGGRGILLGGVPGVAPGRVLILGGGVVGTEAAKIAVGMGAQVQILDINVDRLNFLENLFGSRVELRYSEAAALAELVPQADLVVGAVLVPGKRPPVLINRDLIRQMQPGAVVLDVAIDQGGSIETLRLTSHAEPTYVEEGVVHIGIPNLPGAVPRTATQALNHSTLPYVLKLADQGRAALTTDPVLAGGLNLEQGKIVHPAIREVFPD
ncbi:MAG: alanine dehydrogenase [Pseudanabaenaceae cyanobacterium]